MHADARDLPITAASAEAAQAFDAVMRGYLEYRLDTGARVKAALALDPDMPLALTMRGYMFMLFGMRAFVPRAAKALDAARAASVHATAREQRHVDALDAWVAGDWNRALGHWSGILVEHPHDLLALRLHHYLTFWTGRAASLRNTVAGVLDAWDEDLPGYASVLGMWAFGLEECGDYARAEEAGRLAVEMNPDDLWAIHAVAHVLEMQGRLDDGVAWLERPTDAWDDRNPFRGHLWWHLALFPLEQGDYERVLDIYDRCIEPANTEFYLDVQNMASLLARLELHGVDVGERWAPVAGFSRAAQGDHALPFTDVHCALALARVGDNETLEGFVHSLRSPANAHGAWVARVADVPTAALCEALGAFGGGDYAGAWRGLLALRDDTDPVGGSHAQRDLFHQLMTHAAERDGQAGLSLALWRERAALKPASVGNWEGLARAFDATGDVAQANRARREAEAVRAG